MKEMNQRLLHAAYGIARVSTNHASAKDHLAKQFPNVDWNDIVEAYLMGCELHEQSYAVGLLWHDKKLKSEDEGVETLKGMCPGFSEETYRKAWADGLFESMW